MEKIVEHGLLYDFYGELLTAHQRQIYEDAVYNDMSLGEIAALQGISRQGVHDLLKRCDKALESYEQRLHLVERFQKVREKVARIGKATDELESSAGQTDKTDLSAIQKQLLYEIRNLSDEILGEL